MQLSEFKWWLSNTPATVWRTISQLILDYIESKIKLAFGLARIGTTTETGLQIFWEDARIKPPVADSLRRIFLQTYKQFMIKVGKPNNDELVRDYFGLAYCYSSDLRDHPQLSQVYPFFVVRFWIPPDVLPQTEQEIRDFIKVILPARCTKHYQLLTYIQPQGFGRTPFGRVFGR